MLNHYKYPYTSELHGSSRRCVFLGISEFVVRDSNRRRFLAPSAGARRLIPFVVDLFVFVGLTMSLSEELAIVAGNASIYKLLQVFIHIPNLTVQGCVARREGYICKAFEKYN